MPDFRLRKRSSKEIKVEKLKEKKFVFFWTVIIFLI